MLCLISLFTILTSHVTTPGGADRSSYLSSVESYSYDGTRSWMQPMGSSRSYHGCSKMSHNGVTTVIVAGGLGTVYFTNYSLSLLLQLLLLLQVMVIVNSAVLRPSPCPLPGTWPRPPGDRWGDCLVVGEAAFLSSTSATSTTSWVG